jgi:hypothetical protein
MYPWCELLCNLWWWPLTLLRSWLVCKLVWNPSWFHGLPGYTGLSLLVRLLGGWFSYLISYNWLVLLHELRPSAGARYPWRALAPSLATNARSRLGLSDPEPTPCSLFVGRRRRFSSSNTGKRRGLSAEAKAHLNSARRTGLLGLIQVSFGGLTAKVMN